MEYNIKSETKTKEKKSRIDEGRKRYTEKEKRSNSPHLLRRRRRQKVGRLFEQSNVQVSRKVPHNDAPVLRSTIIMERNERIEVRFKCSCMHKHDRQIISRLIT